MGVPSLFKWISVQFPQCVRDVTEGFPAGEAAVASEANPNGIEFDNLYLDLNGLIHPCAHPVGVEAPGSEKEMVETLRLMLKRMMAMVRPRKLLYLSIDGVAPRAKLNQQRTRRFRRSSDDALMSVDGSTRAPVWDSNVITPGTEFMERVIAGLRDCIREDLLSCEAYRDLTVVLSDSHVCGEGEHKIMSFIRSQRSAPGYDPQTIHCIYGLDADLILLSLGLHEPFVYIIRESVDSFYQSLSANLSTPNANPILSKPFQFICISILREYLERAQFPGSCFLSAQMDYDLERIIQDLIALSCLLGNDFLPHVPCLSIREGGLDYLLGVYWSRLQSHWDGYLVNVDASAGCVSIDWPKLRDLCAELGVVEDRYLQARFETSGEAAAVKRPSPSSSEALGGGEGGVEPPAKRAHTEAPPAPPSLLLYPSPLPLLPYAARSQQGGFSFEDNQNAAEVFRMLFYGRGVGPQSSPASSSSSSSSRSRGRRACPEEIIGYGAPGWRARYYEHKFGGCSPSEACQSYVTGIQWVVSYYLLGCPSWSWYYPYFYAPSAQDLSESAVEPRALELGAPFSPFEQLLGVLPARSAAALPPCLRPLMTSPESPIADFYSSEVRLDPNGERQEWLYVALLPPFDEKRLRAAFESLRAALSPEEVARNAPGDELVFLSAGSRAAPLARAVLSRGSSSLGSFGSFRLDLDPASLPDAPLPAEGVWTLVCRVPRPAQPLPSLHPSLHPAAWVLSTAQLTHPSAYRRGLNLASFA